jgi:DNA repair exonuclease SbcCD nuclease subunit
MASTTFTFAHLADAHVGAWSRDPAVRQALRESVLRALALVEERDCQFLLISGDLFHTPVPEPAEVAPVAAELRRLVDRGRRVYVIYGSHDYVAHRTSWLDVLAETGVFLRSAPEPVRVEGTRWTLPFLVDPGTGAAIGGISGRAHGLDRTYFSAVDSEALRNHDGFRIFQFHAAIDEYLPPGLREHIRGISRSDLPRGLDYYAGGHIHYTYVGEGPEGGLLVNPGAVFGTSVTDLENGAQGKTQQGVVIVRVEDGVPHPEFVRTAPIDAVQVFDVDVSGKTAEEAKDAVSEGVAHHASAGKLLFPRVHGTLSDGSVGTLGLRESRAEADRQGAASVHWDLTDVAGAPRGDTVEPGSEGQLEEATLARLSASVGDRLPELSGEAGLGRLRELLRELGTARSDGEARADYEAARLRSSLALLGVPETDEL